MQKNRDKIHTEGKPFPGVKIKILKSNKFNKKSGEILIKGKNLAYSYENIKIWRSRFVNSFYKSGDLGIIDKNGYLIFKGRIENRINFNGKIYNTELIEEKIKKKFKLNKLKILSRKIKGQLKIILFIESKTKIQTDKLYLFLRKENININFYRLSYINFNKQDTGKINAKKLIKYFK